MKTFKTELSLIELKEANPRQLELLQKAKKENRMVPNMYKAMANSPALLDSYMHGYRLFRQESGFTSAEAEIVFLTISAENHCVYCMGAHSLLADTSSKVPVEVTEAIRNNQKIPHEKFNKLSEFTSIMVNKRGLPTEEDVNVFLDAGYNENHVLSIILAISIKTISNYTNHIFHTELDTVFKSREWKGYKATRGFINFFRRLE
jgi:uncharacterized peroxidase-related enzyme